MTIISLERTIFALPEDFDGTFADALREMAAHFETPKPNLEPKAITPIDADPRGWRAFQEVVAMGGRFSGVCGFSRWNGISWEDLPKGVVYADTGL